MYIPAEVKFANRKRSPKFQNYYLLVRVTPEARLFLHGLTLAKESNIKIPPPAGINYLFIYFLNFIYLFLLESPSIPLSAISTPALRR